MSSVKSNERELASQIISWFNAHINRNDFPFSSASGEVGTKVGQKTYFGDVVIWENRAANEALCLIELKQPYGTENMETFSKKALELKVKLAYTWDFVTLKAYQIEHGKLVLVDTDNATPVMHHIEDWKRGDVQADIKAYIYRICEELVNLSEQGTFSKFKPEKHYFIKFLRATVKDLIPVFEWFVKNKSEEPAHKANLKKYAVEQGIAQSSIDAFYRLVASQAVYGLVNKIIFYLTVKRYFEDLPPLRNPEFATIEERLKYAFSEAKAKDWQAVFELSSIEKMGIPERATNTLEELFSQLKIYNFGQLPEDVIGELFEEIIDPNQRHSLGQYFTREDLVDLVLATVVRNTNGHYVDPTCGSGTFLMRLYDRLKYLTPSLSHMQILEKIWGIDIGKFPAELSTINLFRQDVTNFSNFPRVVHSSIFKVERGASFEFPPPKVRQGKNYRKISRQIPDFQAIVGNFPFIRQELIEKKDEGFKKQLTATLAYNYFFSYPELFNFKSNGYDLEYLKTQSKKRQDAAIQHLLERNKIQLNLSGQADIYAYMFIHTATLLAEKGEFAIITSNSWLDVSYGTVLKKFFLDHFKIKMIVASWVEPWFDDASVNTIFTVLEKCTDAQERATNEVSFVKLTKPLGEMIPFKDLQLERRKRYERLDSLVNIIECSHMTAKKLTSFMKYQETEFMEIRVVQQQYLYDQVTKNDNPTK